MINTALSTSENYSVVAFYGLDHNSITAEKYFAASLRGFQLLGLPPDKLVISGEGHNSKFSTFERGSKKLSKMGFDGVAGFEIYATEPNGKIWWWDCIVSSQYEGQIAGSHAHFMAKVSVASLESPAMVSMAAEMVRLLNPTYGIGFVRSKKSGPGPYVAGIAAGPEDHVAKGAEYEEELRICRWGDIGMPEQVYRLGYIRDVYLRNYLSEVQLAKPVHGTTLRDWILQDNSRGKLSPLTENLTEWVVDSDQIPEIREPLDRAGNIFDWKKWIK